MKMVLPTPLSVVANRGAMKDGGQLPDGVEFLGSVPESRTLRQFDREGRSLWELPPKNRAVVAVRNIAQALGFFTDNL
jgi:CO dehydrogenase maturation factor